MTFHGNVEHVEAPSLRYTRVAISLHWVIAFFILFNLAFGFFMEGLPPALRGVIMPLHISAGFTVLVLTVMRVLWRLTHHPPPELQMASIEGALAPIVHFLLYAGMVLMPLTGWALMSAHAPAGSRGAIAEAAMRPPPPPTVSRLPVAPPGPPRIWWLIPFKPIGPIARIGETAGGVPPQKALHDEFVTAHGIGGWVMIALLLLHICGALKHQILDRQPELQRMGIGRRRGADPA